LSGKEAPTGVTVTINQDQFLDISS